MTQLESGDGAVLRKDTGLCLTTIGLDARFRGTLLCELLACAFKGTPTAPLRDALGLAFGSTDCMVRFSPADHPASHAEVSARKNPNCVLPCHAQALAKRPENRGTGHSLGFQ